MSEFLKNTAGQVVYVCAVDAVTGAAKTSGVSFYVTLDSGSQNAASGTATHVGNGTWRFAPTQGETNGDVLGYSWGGTDVIPGTITIYTTTATLADVKSQTAAIETDTQDLQTQVGVAGAGLTAIAPPSAASIAAAVWSAGTRSLTTFGTLVSDVATAVWAYATRLLTGGTNLPSADDIADEVESRLSGFSVEVVSPLGEDGTLTIVQGDDYRGDLKLPFRVPDYTGPDVGTLTTKALGLMLTSEYNATGGELALEVEGSAEMDGDDAVFSFEITSAQSGALEASPPDDALNYVYQLRIADASGYKRTYELGAATVKKAVLS